ncbi:G patch domain-containing protein 4-like [Macrobrachium nipponense]|uniref:G patch domain-containing protein 4-like n=1 Tax=Macrobrachium nipponense TaxID=159736 RepID=UPI0030C84798
MAAAYLDNLNHVYYFISGKGLGREEDGVANPIKVNGNFSGYGLGHDVGKEFKNQWWDHVYNKTASNMMVAKSEDGSVKVERKGVQDSKKVVPYAKSSQYSSFVKAGVLEDVAEEEDMSLKLSYDELFKICGGKTAHKGARHGLTMTAKLARVKQQEEDLMAKLHKLGDQNSLEAVKVSGETVEKSKRKETSKTCSDEHSLLPKAINGCTESTDLEQYSRKHKKEKKQKRKNSDCDTGTYDKHFPSSAVNLDCVVEMVKSKLSKKERKLLAKGNGGEDLLRNEFEVEKKMKKKKCTESENYSDPNGNHFSDEPTVSILCNGKAHCEFNEERIVTKLIGEMETERTDISREGNVIKKNSKKKRDSCENFHNVTNTTSNIQCDEASELRLSKKERKRLRKLNKLVETEGLVNSNTENKVELKPKKKVKSNHKEKEGNFEHVSKENDEEGDIVLDDPFLKKEHKSRKRERTEIVIGVGSSESNELKDGFVVVSDELGNESVRKKKKKCKRNRQEK